MANMKTYILLLYAIGLFTLISCEKLDFTKPSTGSEIMDSTHVAEIVVHAIPADSVLEAFVGNGNKTIHNANVVGYIVGYVNGSSMKSCVFEAGENAKETNIILASTPVETNYERCIPIQLSNSTNACSSVRNALNLFSNPNMLRKKVCLTGDVSEYMGTVGLTGTKNYILLPDDFNYDSDTIHAEEETDTVANKNDVPTDNKNIIDHVDNHGYDETNPFCVYDIIHYLPVYLESKGGIGIQNVFTKGYIVGFINGNSINKAIFGAIECTVETNILLADSPDEADYNKCIAVQLSTSSNNTKNVREALNLKNHPENIGKCVMLFGNVEKYMGQMGIKNTRYYEFIE